jgi:hypothetical protein
MPLARAAGGVFVFGRREMLKIRWRSAPVKGHQYSHVFNNITAKNKV